MTDAVVQSLRLPAMLSARIGGGAGDGAATVVLGRRLCDVLGALGVPVRDWLAVSRWVDDDDDREALGGYVDVLVADRCRLPGDDLVSDLVAHDCDGRGLTAEEVHAIVADCLAAAAQSS